MKTLFEKGQRLSRIGMVFAGLGLLLLLAAVISWFAAGFENQTPLQLAEMTAPLWYKAIILSALASLAIALLIGAAAECFLWRDRRRQSYDR